MGSGLKRQKWSPEEDEKLIRYIKEHEPARSWSWASIPEQAGLSRSPKSCNSRYNDYLRMREDLKRGDFTREEEDTIVRLHQCFGNSWAAIAKYFPGRSKTEIKNHWRHNIMGRVRWIMNNDGTSDMVMLPNLDKNKEKPRENESCTSSSRSAVGEEVELSGTNLEIFDPAEVDMVNNTSKNSNLSSSSDTGGEELAWSSTNFELHDDAEMGVFNSTGADDGNWNVGGISSGTGGEELAWSPTDFEMYDGAEMGVFNSTGADDGNRNDGGISSGTGGEELAWSPADFEMYDGAEMGVFSSIVPDDGNVNYGDSSSGIGGEELGWSPIDFELPDGAEMGIFDSFVANDGNRNDGGISSGTGGEEPAWSSTDFQLYDGAEIGFLNSNSIAEEELAHPASSNWFDCEDRAMMNSSLIEDDYFGGSMELAASVRNDIPQGDINDNMPAEMGQRINEIDNKIMGESQDDIVDAQAPDGLDLVYASFADCL